MTATDELRRLLDERGVEWDGTDSPYGLPQVAVTTTFVAARYREWPSGTTAFNASNLTPAQAIAATLGRGTCRITDNGPWGYPYVCSACGASYDADVNNGEFNFCPNCGARVVE